MRRKILFTTIVTTLMFFLMFFGTSILVHRNPNPQLDQPIETQRDDILTLDFSKPTPPPLNQEQPKPNLKQTAWIADFDFDRGYNAFVRNYHLFDSVSPVWYHLDRNGNVKANRQRATELVNFGNKHRIKVIPSIASFEYTRLNKLLSNRKRLNNHINFLISEVDKYGLDGLDIDHESITLIDQTNFLYMMQRLYDELEVRGKKLTVAVHPQWTDTNIKYGLRETNIVQNWEELGQVSHEVRIMSYNLTYSGAKYPGPVSPLDWLEAITRRAVTKIDPEKIFLGIGLYGYDGWSDNPTILDSYLGPTANGRARKIQADAVTFNQIQKLRAKYQTSDQIDPSSKEKVMEYKYKGKKYIIFYTDTEAATYRYNLARDYGIGGVAHWRLGGEDENIYQLVTN